jgi:hypothetical protein
MLSIANASYLTSVSGIGFTANEPGEAQKCIGYQGVLHAPKEFLT